jgi:hypothetical protein
LKGTKIPTSVEKMPDFTNNHKDIFERIKCVLSRLGRNLDRAIISSSAVAKVLQPVMVVSPQSSAAKQIPSRNPVTRRWYSS